MINDDIIPNFSTFFLYKIRKKKKSAAVIEWNGLDLNKRFSETFNALEKAF